MLSWGTSQQDTLQEDSPGIDEVVAGDCFTPESGTGTSSSGTSHSTEAPEESCHNEVSIPVA